jgi:hypothetical protein
MARWLRQLPLVLVPASLSGEIGVQELVVLVPGHGTESLLPALSRSLGRTNHNLGVLHFEFYFGAKTALLEEDLGDAHTLRIAILMIRVFIAYFTSHRKVTIAYLQCNYDNR